MRIAPSSIQLAPGDKRLSLLALAEIPIAMALLWSFALTTTRPWFTILAFMAVPLLLLRSPESIAEGVRRLTRYWSRQEADFNFRQKSVARVLHVIFFVSIASASLKAFSEPFDDLRRPKGDYFALALLWLLIIQLVVAYRASRFVCFGLLAGSMIRPESISAHVARSFSIAFKLSAVGACLLLALVSPVEQLLAQGTLGARQVMLELSGLAIGGVTTWKLWRSSFFRRREWPMRSILLASSIYISMELTVAASFIFDLGGTLWLAGADAMAAMAFRWTLGRLAQVAFLLPFTVIVIPVTCVLSTLLVLVPPLVVGIGLRIAFVRIAATARYAHKGLEHYVDNCAEIVLRTDLLRPPELIPDSSRIGPELSLTGLWKIVLSKAEGASREGLMLRIGWVISGIVYSLLIWVPAAVYRLNIKAAFWLWGSLAVAFSPTTWLDEDMRAKTSYWSTWLLIGGAITAWMSLFASLLLQHISDSRIRKLFPPSILDLSELLPPSVTIRSFSIWASLLVVAGVLHSAYAIRAAHGKALEAAHDYRSYGEELQPHLRKMAHSLRRWLKIAFAISVLTCWIFILWMANEVLPPTKGSAAWIWMKNSL